MVLGTWHLWYYTDRRRNLTILSHETTRKYQSPLHKSHCHRSWRGSERGCPSFYFLLLDALALIYQSLLHPFKSQINEIKITIRCLIREKVRSIGLSRRGARASFPVSSLGGAAAFSSGAPKRGNQGLISLIGLIALLNSLKGLFSKFIEF